MIPSILIIADALGPRETIAPILTSLNIKDVRLAASPSAALLQLRDTTPDIIVLPMADVPAGDLSQFERLARQRPEMSVLTTGPHNRTDLLKLTLQHKFADYISTPVDKEELTTALDRALRQRRPSDRGKIIAIYSAKGGTGCTTITATLGRAIAQQDPKAVVSVVDFVTSGDLALFVGATPRYTLADLSAKPLIDAELVQAVLHTIPGGVSLLASPADLASDMSVTVEVARTVLDRLRDRFAVTVIDCDHHVNSRTITALEMADTIFIVSKADLPTVKSTLRTMEVLKSLEVPVEKVRVILNRYAKKDVFTPSGLKERLRVPEISLLPDDPETALEAVHSQKTPIDHNPKSPLAKAYVDLASTLPYLDQQENSHAPMPTGFKSMFGIGAVRNGVA